LAAQPWAAKAVLRHGYSLNSMLSRQPKQKVRAGNRSADDRLSTVLAAMGDVTAFALSKPARSTVSSIKQFMVLGTDRGALLLFRLYGSDVVQAQSAAAAAATSPRSTNQPASIPVSSAQWAPQLIRIWPACSCRNGWNSSDHRATSSHHTMAIRTANVILRTEPADSKSCRCPAGIRSLQFSWTASQLLATGTMTPLAAKLDHSVTQTPDW